MVEKSLLCKLFFVEFFLEIKVQEDSLINKMEHFQRLCKCSMLI